MHDSTAIVWFDRDLRLRDHPALTAATRQADVLVPVYVAEPDRSWPPSAPQIRWLRQSLEELSARLERRGHELTLRRGAPPDELARLVEEVDADSVHWSRRFGAGCDDGDVVDALADTPATAEPTSGRLLHDPDSVETTSGGPYHVYTPFWNKFLDVVDIGDPLPIPDLGSLDSPDSAPVSKGIADVLPAASDAAFEAVWTPGAEGARERLTSFLDDTVDDYTDGRDVLGREGTSRLSPHLHFGEISPRQIWSDIADSSGVDELGEGPETFLGEIVWREFAYHLLHHYPETATEPLKEKFRGFEWVADGDAFERWTAGRTGYPVVDAGMRQLRETGWMHNRARMIVASFLTKDLRIPWQWGAEWFWDHLVDADLPNNTMGWQWAAGCGADAQPFFRIFNPVTQGERHDPDATYIRRWVPELDDLSARAAHRPWDHDGDLDYPDRMVDHSEAREEALEAWEAIK